MPMIMFYVIDNSLDSSRDLLERHLCEHLAIRNQNQRF